MKTITVFRGDGIGPEIIDATLQILQAAKVDLAYEIFDVGQNEYEKHGQYISDDAFASFEKNHVLLKSPISTPIGHGFRSLNVLLRKKYDLYANIRPARSIENIQTRYNDVDIIIFRENTEDLYVGKEEWKDDETVYAYKIITKKASTRIIKAAFEYAKKHGRKKVTCVHKANILKESDGLFLRLFNQIKEDYPDIETNDLIVDNTCMQLVMNPNQFDVMVMPNLYGDILSDLCAGLVGGLGLIGSCNKSSDYAMYEAVHGSAPDIAGKGIANPTALIKSACMLLKDNGQEAQAASIENALDQVFKEGKILTPDLKGSATTQEFVDAIIKKLTK